MDTEGDSDENDIPKGSARIIHEIINDSQGQLLGTIPKWCCGMRNSPGMRSSPTPPSVTEV